MKERGLHSTTVTMRSRWRTDISNNRGWPWRRCSISWLTWRPGRNNCGWRLRRGWCSWFEAASTGNRYIIDSYVTGIGRSYNSCKGYLWKQCILQILVSNFTNTSRYFFFWFCRTHAFPLFILTPHLFFKKTTGSLRDKPLTLFSLGFLGLLGPG